MDDVNRNLSSSNLKCDGYSFSSDLTTSQGGDTYSENSSTFRPNPTVTYPVSDIYPSSSDNRSAAFSNRIYESQSSAFSQQQLADAENSRWRTINETLRLRLPGDGRIQRLWRDLAMKLYDEVIESEREKINEFRYSFWDFCVIHANDSIDLEITKEFITMMTSEGLSGVSAMKQIAGENKLDVAEIVLNGSTKIFVLLSPALNFPGLHRTFFQDVFLRRFKEPFYRRRLIPLQPSFNHLLMYKNKYPLCNPMKLPLGLNTIGEIVLSDISTTVEEVRNFLTVDRQMMVMEKRIAEKKSFQNRLKENRSIQLAKLKRGIEKLQEQLGDERDPSDHLHLMLEQLNQNLDGQTEASSCDTLVNMKDCNQVQVGTAINFNFGPNPERWE